MYVYEYHPDGAKGELGEVKAIGIKRGDVVVQNKQIAPNQGIYWLEANERGIAERPELITRRVRFSEPVTSYATGGDEEITSYSFHDADASHGIRSKVVSRPAASMGSFAGGGSYYPTSGSWFYAKGNRGWSAKGLPGPRATDRGTS